MKAVFCCQRPYYQIARAAVMNRKIEYTEAFDLMAEDGTPVHIPSRAVESFKELPPMQNTSFTFCEGTKHDLLTLTDPEEIIKFRAFYPRLDVQITEVYFEPDEVIAPEDQAKE